MKMQQYGLSEKRILRIIKNPKRKEEGIAPGTIAVMQNYGTKKHQKEIWVMYQIKEIKSQKSKVKIISAWRYPGKSPIGKPPQIPEDTLRELENLTF
jgi:hypothetical protein